jgi:hypothetical protein
MDLEVETLRQEYLEAVTELANIQRANRQIRAVYNAYLEFYSQILTQRDLTSTKSNLSGGVFL